MSALVTAVLILALMALASLPARRWIEPGPHRPRLHRGWGSGPVPLRMLGACGLSLEPEASR
jgi:hypothetical protein